MATPTATPTPAVIKIAGASHGTAPRVIVQQAQRPSGHTRKNKRAHSCLVKRLGQNSDKTMPKPIRAAAVADRNANVQEQMPLFDWDARYLHESVPQDPRCGALLLLDTSQVAIEDEPTLRLCSFRRWLFRASGTVSLCRCRRSSLPGLQSRYYLRRRLGVNSKPRRRRSAKLTSTKVMCYWNDHTKIERVRLVSSLELGTYLPVGMCIV